MTAYEIFWVLIDLKLCEVHIFSAEYTLSYKHSVFLGISLSMLMIFIIQAWHYACGMLKIIESVVTVMI